MYPVGVENCLFRKNLVIERLGPVKMHALRATVPLHNQKQNQGLSLYICWGLPLWQLSWFRFRLTGLSLRDLPYMVRQPSTFQNY